MIRRLGLSGTATTGFQFAFAGNYQGFKKKGHSRTEYTWLSEGHPDPQPTTTTPTSLLYEQRHILTSHIIHHRLPAEKKKKPFI